MHISSCLHPVKVYNKYSNETMYVPCGKCAACANSRAKRWIDKLEQESRCWKYTFNLYLDYSDKYVPTYQIVGEYLFEQQPRFFKCFTFDEVCIPLLELNVNNDYDLDYLVSRCDCHNGIPHASVKDIQNFKKRLNKYIFKHITGKYENFRSAIVAEYGPTTFRGHYHGMLFFNDDRIAARIGEAVSKCWSFGHSTADSPKKSTHSVAGYIAQYLNRPTHLPKIYSHRALSPFFLTSRHPPIGSLFESSEEIRKIFFDCSCTRATDTLQDGIPKVQFVPLPSHIKDRLFPKCPRFGSLDDFSRVKLYRCLLKDSGEPYGTFEECMFFFRRKIGIKFQDYGFSISNNSWLFEFWNNVTERFTNLNSLLSLYRVTRRIYFQSAIFGITYDEYVSQILKFYKKYELFKLHQFYEYQEKYAEVSPSDDLAFAYPLDIDLYNGQPLWLQERLDINKNDSFLSYKSHCEFIFEESHKRMKQNGYLEKLALRDSVLCSILKKYHYAKKCNENDEASSDYGSQRLRLVSPSGEYFKLRRNFAVLKYPYRTRWKV